MIVLVIIEAVVIALLVFGYIRLHNDISSIETTVTRRLDDSYKDCYKQLRHEFAKSSSVDELSDAVSDLGKDFDDYTVTMKKWGDELVHQVAHDHMVLMKTTQGLGDLHDEMHQPYFGDEVLDPDEKEIESFDRVYAVSPEALKAATKDDNGSGK